MKLLHLKRLLLGLIIVSLLVTSIGTLPGSAAQEEIELWVSSLRPSLNEVLEKFIDEFERDQNVRIFYTPIPPNEYWQRMSTGFGAGDVPDIFWSNKERLKELVESGRVQEIPAEAIERIKEISDEVLEQFAFEGRLYGIPVSPSGNYARSAYAISRYSKHFELAIELINFLQVNFQIITNYKLTRQSLESLRDEGIPNNILGDLEWLEDQEFTSYYEFLNAIEKQIGQGQTNEYRQLILRYVERDIYASSSN